MPSGRRILLLINTGKPEVREALPTIRAAIAAGGGQVVHETAAVEEPPIAWSVHAAAAVNNPDLIVTLGGDGTLLAQTRRFINSRLPMLGVNFGKLGFLAEFDLATLVEHSSQLFGGRALSTIERPMLAVFIVRSGTDPHRDTDGPFHLALNDAAIIAGPPHRMIRVGLSVDGHPGPQILGDGVIVCTPAGSTAYNVSAGGPILAPEVRAVCITAIAAHTLAFRPVVISGESTVELTLDRANDPPRGQPEGVPGCGTVLLLDGRDAGKLTTGDRVITRLHSLPASFVKNPDVGYWETLGTKMHWGVGPGR